MCNGDKTFKNRCEFRNECNLYKEYMEAAIERRPLDNSTKYLLNSKTKTCANFKSIK